jgi:hypothetical protein
VTDRLASSALVSRSRQEFDYGAAVYGSVLVTALIGTSFEAHFGARSMTLTTLTTTFVFWLAHVWSEVMGVRLTGTVPRWSEVRSVAVSEWPLVEAGFVPDLLLALAWAGVYARDTGAELALIAAVPAARRLGLRRRMAYSPSARARGRRRCR